MKGSFENPPIVISQSPGKLVLTAVCSLVFASMIWALSSTSRNPVILDIIAGFFLVMSPLLAFFAYRPASLTIAPDGITWHTSFRTLHYDWWQFDDFSVAEFNFNKKVWFGYRKKRDGAVRLGSFGGLWELGPRELLDLVIQAQRRWANPPIS